MSPVIFYFFLGKAFLLSTVLKVIHTIMVHKKIFENETYLFFIFLMTKRK
ncbi:hypothetical protein AsAng_0051880 [Aureispira anguillae]|uniref:Uncharacterized protein n=1 Tax=Aureispira anguillae TaxID=2864201 RepID=A0A915YJT5_9BACT|nr:hypothetical protein AsAng_0051880 [Aureispira anguillae]